MKKDPYATLPEAPLTHWRSIEHKDGAPSVLEFIHDEFQTPPSTGLTRRDALKISGASAALSFLAACTKLRRPEEGILPFVRQPENVIPGVRLRYATASQRSEGALGLIVEVHDGRPTKIEGNPRHPSSLGTSDIWAQTEIMRVYDPDRSRAPKGGGATWEAWDGFAKDLSGRMAGAAGKGLAILAPHAMGPTFERLLKETVAKMPEAKVYRFDPLAPENAMLGAELAFGPGARVHHDLEPVKVVFSFESDFMCAGPDHLRLARAFGASRAVKNGEDVARMKRLYVAEGAWTSTGASADHRLRWASGQQVELLKALAQALTEKHQVQLGEVAGAVSGVTLPPDAQKFVEAAAKDLAANGGKALVLVGETQAPAVHALGHAINMGLAALGQGMKVTTGSAPFEGLGALVASLEAGAVETLAIFESNPLYAAPGGYGFTAAFGKAKTTIHVGVLADETGTKATWHLPAAHFLESWGDAEAWDGTASIVQPLMHPLFGARAPTFVLAQLAGMADTNDKVLVEATWRGKGMALEENQAWRKALHEGVIEGVTRAALEPLELKATSIVEGLSKVEVKAPTQAALELVALHTQTQAGLLSNVEWIMELPDSMSKLCWDNAVLMAPSLAKSLGVASAVDRNRYKSDLIELSVDGRKIVAPTFVLPGLAPFTLVMNSGFGRTFGLTCKGVGVDVNPLLGKGSAVYGVAAKKKVETVELCSTQDHFSVPGNPLRELTFAQMTSEPASAPERKLGLGTRPLFRSGDATAFAKDGGKLFRTGDLPAKALEPNTPKTNPVRPIQLTADIHYEGQQWGMVVDLSACIGCNACTVACNSENNIPSVGREQVMLGREMHWIRIDRYFSGDVETPEAAHQPVACQHCENAPCEPVCPVSATVHDEEGMNGMAYNRCIGTRYCANNCPFKVRRFNYLDYTHTANFYVEPFWKERMKTLELQRNPDVSVRYRGVMEKCTYCTQRVEEAKIAAKREGKDRKGLPDGAVTPACAETCPTQAITFGNINDEKSRVAELKKSERNYEMLQELNIRPRTTYLARIKNENEELT